MKEHVAILFSGNGSTMERVVHASRNGNIPIEIGCVITNNSSAPGIEKAKNAGIRHCNIIVLKPNEYMRAGTVDPDRLADQLLTIFEDRSISCFAQYGWMLKTPKAVIDAYPENINQHPGPLRSGSPDFGGKDMYGKRVHAARLYFTRATQRDFWTEATAQRVATKYDAGEVLNTTRIEILPDDSPETLSQRLLPIEHSLHIKTLTKLVKNQLTTQPNEPLVQPGEEHILDEAKRIATMLYPKG